MRSLASAAWPSRSASVPIATDRTSGVACAPPTSPLGTLTQVRARWVRGVVVCALALTAAACGGGNDTSNASKRSDSSPTTTTVPVVPVALPDACPTIHGTTTIAQSSGPRPPGLLTDADAGAEGCLDRVTFYFESLGDGTPPGYRVAYQDPPFTDGDPPEEIAVDGNAFLSVTISPAS